MQQNWMPTLSFLFSIKYDEISNKFILDEQNTSILTFPACTVDCRLSMHLRKKSSENVLKNEDIKAWESHESVGKSRERGNIQQTIEQVKVNVLCDFHHNHRKVTKFEAQAGKI